MTAVGIDVSKGKSMAAALRPLGEVVLEPEEYPHTREGLALLAERILALGGAVRVILESTGHYHEPVVEALRRRGISVCVLNPLLIKYSGGSIRKVKTDKADAIKIAKYGLDNWTQLRPCTPEDDVRTQLKLCSRQYNLYRKTVMAMQNNLISLCDKAFPGVNELFSSLERPDGTQKWVDFLMTFWHCECVAQLEEEEFQEAYLHWCRERGYYHSRVKAVAVYRKSGGQITTLPPNSHTRLLITTAAWELTQVRGTMAQIREEMIALARRLPEYETVAAMYGVGEVTAAQLMAEIGDVRRFPRRSALVGFAGVDPAVYQSGKTEAQSSPMTKRGSPHLRRTLYQVVCAYLKHAPADEPVYQFLDKKRAEGKHYFVYMTAAQNKFLRIYYARVKECLEKCQSCYSAPVRTPAGESVTEKTCGKGTRG